MVSVERPVRIQPDLRILEEPETNVGVTALGIESPLLAEVEDLVTFAST